MCQCSESYLCQNLLSHRVLSVIWLRFVLTWAVLLCVRSFGRRMFRARRNSVTLCSSPWSRSTWSGDWPKNTSPTWHSACQQQVRTFDHLHPLLATLRCTLLPLSPSCTRIHTGQNTACRMFLLKTCTCVWAFARAQLCTSICVQTLAQWVRPDRWMLRRRSRWCLSVCCLPVLHSLFIWQPSTRLGKKGTMRYPLLLSSLLFRQPAQTFELI